MEEQAISTKQRASLLEALQAWCGRGSVSEEQAGRILEFRGHHTELVRETVP